MPDDVESQLAALVEAVRRSAKYRHVNEATVRALGQRELRAGRSWKEAVKATKNKLHQIAGAYLTGKPRYNAWLAELATAARQGEDALRVACAAVMQHHASTRERLPLLETFYAVTLDGLPPIRSVLDVACGLNPLAVGWMPLAAGARPARYYACDLYTDLAAFLNAFFRLAGVAGRAWACDLLTAPPDAEADLALALKILPPLEQVDRDAPLRLLRGLRARWVLVSYPVHSLGGRRDRGMRQNYERRFRELIAGEGWAVERFTFETELVFRVRKAIDD